MESAKALSAQESAAEEQVLQLITSYMRGSLRKSWSVVITVEAVGDSMLVEFTRSTNRGIAQVPASPVLLATLKHYRQLEPFWFTLKFRLSKSNEKLNISADLRTKPAKLNFQEEDLWLELALHDRPPEDFPEWFREELDIRG